MDNIGKGKNLVFDGGISHDIFVNIISTENLYLSWKEFKKGKMGKADVQEFALNLENNLFRLHDELKSKTYKHSHYTSFFINDPKRRHIHKACVLDRIVHHAIYRILYPIFDKGFIYDSYSCRNEKGTHKAVDRLQAFIRSNGAPIRPRRTRHGRAIIIKCDIKKFFASINHEILFDLIKKKIKDENVLWLIKGIINSFCVGATLAVAQKTIGRGQAPLLQHEKQIERERESTKNSARGIPLGNLTSQLFANIYLNELDQFIKHQLKIKHYIRYCDDFVMILNCRGAVSAPNKIRGGATPPLQDINEFLFQELKLKLHPDKTIIRKPNQGIDFLGYVIFLHHKVLRTKTKKRMYKKIKEKRGLLNSNDISLKCFRQTIMSYMGVCSHAKAFRIKKGLNDIYKEENIAKYLN